MDCCQELRRCLAHDIAAASHCLWQPRPREVAPSMQRSITSRRGGAFSPCPRQVGKAAVPRVLLSGVEQVRESVKDLSVPAVCGCDVEAFSRVIYDVECTRL